MANQLASLREENFADAQKYKPERWLNPSPDDTAISVPFGWGRRSWLLRELVETQVSQAAAKVIAGKLLLMGIYKLCGCVSYCRLFVIIWSNIIMAI